MFLLHCKSFFFGCRIYESLLYCLSWSMQIVETQLFEEQPENISNTKKHKNV